MDVYLHLFSLIYSVFNLLQTSLYFFLPNHLSHSIFAVAFNSNQSFCFPSYFYSIYTKFSFIPPIHQCFPSQQLQQPFWAPLSHLPLLSYYVILHFSQFSISIFSISSLILYLKPPLFPSPLPSQGNRSRRLRAHTNVVYKEKGKRKENNKAFSWSLQKSHIY